MSERKLGTVEKETNCRARLAAMKRLEDNNAVILSTIGKQEQLSDRIDILSVLCCATFPCRDCGVKRNSIGYSALAAKLSRFDW